MATVLVVDDDAPSREFMYALLSYRGHHVEQAPNGDRALTMATQRPPDVVITDVLMPGLDGYELARALRGEPATRHIPIVFNTAHPDPQEIRPLAHACGVREVIFKPAQPSTVLATIDSLLVPAQTSVLPADQVAEIQRLTRSGTWEVDLATNMIVVSPQLRDILGLPAWPLATHELIRRVHPEDVAAIAGMLENKEYTGSPVTTELRVVGADHTVRELIVSCQAASADRSAPVSRLWGVAQDVTQIRAELRTTSQAQVNWHAVRRAIDAFHRAALPMALPTVAGAALAAVHVPAPERLDIGAAWYDAQVVADGRLILSVGKVAGHDQHPAAVMAQVLAVVRAYAHADPDPVDVLARLNRFLIDTCSDDTFVTAVVAVFDPETGHLRVANGGHPAPLVVSCDSEGSARAAVLDAAGPALGILPGAVFPQVDLNLAAGSAFCAYTDGLTDRHDDPASLGGPHLRQVVTQSYGRLLDGDPLDRLSPAQVLAEDIIGEMLGGAAPDDDFCVAVLHADTRDV